MADEHTLVITLDGGQTATHPDGDREGCDFDDYVSRDWTGSTWYGRWLFTWHAGGESQPEGYWNGIRQDLT